MLNVRGVSFCTRCGVADKLFFLVLLLQMEETASDGGPRIGKSKGLPPVVQPKPTKGPSNPSGSADAEGENGEGSNDEVYWHVRRCTCSMCGCE